jgi:hypothetical protein
MPEDEVAAAHAEGVVAGRIDQRLADHDVHFTRINGSLDDVANELRELTMVVKANLVSAEATEKVVGERRKEGWSTRERLIAGAGVAVAVVIGVLQFIQP